MHQDVYVNSSGTAGLSLASMGFITFLVFLILKVTNTWTEISWFWVFFPLWIPWAIGGAILLIALIIGGILMLCDN